MDLFKSIGKPGAALIAALVLLMLGPSEALSQPNLYLRAPEVIPGTLPEMRTTSYWIDRMENPDEVILSRSGIEEMNRNYHQKMSDMSGLDEDLANRFQRQMMFSPGLVATKPDLDAMTPGEISETVRDIVNRQAQNLQRRSYGNRLAIEYSDSQVADMVEELDHGAIPDEIDVRHGITVVTSRLRTIPPIRPEYVGLTQTGKTRWDLWNLDVIPIGSPVEILHVSKTGGFVFVLTDRGYGWIDSENVAIGSESEINDFVEDDNFIVVTGDRVPFYSGSDATFVSGWMRMGDRLPKAGDRQIEVPVRRTNGDFATETAWLATDADVSTGYLPYTRRNVVVQSFKLLDTIYDWTGGWLGRNHATNLRDIFSTFGFDLPSNGGFVAHFNENTEVVPEDQDREAKYETILVNVVP